MSTEGPRAVVIGIDFGTTFSGVAWCFTGDPDKIRVIKNWPGSRNNQEKVPTVLSYAKKAKSETASPTKVKWGFEIKPETPNQISWFKLFLDDPTASGLQAGMVNINRSGHNESSATGEFPELSQAKSMFLDLGKTKRPVDIVTDYLRVLHAHLQYSLKKAYPESVSEQFGNEIVLKYCLTVPALWSDKAKAMTIEAAKAAGMGQGRNEIRLVAEPEAAAIHCLKMFQATEKGLKVGDVYVLADCGGGTVDLISYEITAVSPRLSVKEAAPGKGAFCGSTTLNRRFEDLVKSRIGEESFQNMTTQARWSTLNHFEDYLKKTFLPGEEDDDEDEFEIESYYCPIPGVPNDVAKGIQGGFLVLTVDELVEVFRPSFDEITTLVQEQIGTAEKSSGRAVTGVLLVGGYGSSEYLLRHLRANIRSSNDSGAVTILQPADAWTAVVRGAVADGVALHESSIKAGPGGRGSSIVESRIARFSYGIAACEPFIEGIHPVNKLYYSYRFGEFMCRDRMTWFVEKGQQISEKKDIRVSLETSAAVGAGRSEFKATQMIFYSDAATPPTDREDKSVRSLLRYEADAYDMPTTYFTRSKAPAGGEDFWTIPMDMVMHYDSAGLVFWSEIRNPNGDSGTRMLGKSMKIEYDHEVPQ
ncbi:hypothetical protein DFH27DRAFT_565692 [Peziza echinospora]|nr:hypothetical protein DFH27DRAFT_565692 [Peziza echinospora]